MGTVYKVNYVGNFNAFNKFVMKRVFERVYNWGVDVFNSKINDLNEEFLREHPEHYINADDPDDIYNVIMKDRINELLKSAGQERIFKRVGVRCADFGNLEVFFRKDPTKYCYVTMKQV